MSDLISRQVAIDAIEHRLADPEYLHNGEDWYVGMNSAEFIISELPSVQPEIIMCKDCEHWDKSWANDWEPNCHYCPMIDRVCGENWFCAGAERRTDEAD